MIQCKRVYEQAGPDDGYRVLVDKLWPRGVKKTDLAYDEWCKALTPSNELRKAFHSETIDFAAFSQAYREELAQHADEGMRLAARAKKTDRHPALRRKKHGAKSRPGISRLAAPSVISRWSAHPRFAVLHPG